MVYQKIYTTYVDYVFAMESKKQIEGIQVCNEIGVHQRVSRCFDFSIGT